MHVVHVPAYGTDCTYMFIDIPCVFSYLTHCTVMALWCTVNSAKIRDGVCDDLEKAKFVCLNVIYAYINVRFTDPHRIGGKQKR